ncbi:hypothetical protein BACT_0309 [Bifidobacterium actinocoloniiforme DSM 22766]|uniref:DUF3290 domain-containing protein n=1 Tax=Bifidobacterium actinocoloniiforme DSM 22766 TaxID=1437605 RepID=A0A086YVV3_9BIFI|nr:DUF3290 domain-containing protein [Bifidobacterium actinocoloniiforme]AKV54943.1 hypothetical protein AB656_00090 [Bifidobacterium actinocoloniiforme DSM 22766]KFI38403.1 hypothetical protein BACT_0309 [Bifidobacterium actinocoloniiforme DSM 22766]
MTFYTYDYLKGGQTNWAIAKIVVIALLALAFLVFMVKYTRNKWDMKYKDLSIILGTLLLLAVAIQYSDFTNLRTASVQSGQLTVVIEKSAKKLGVDPHSVAINDTSRNNNMLVKTPKGYYSLVFNGSGSEFLLVKANLYEPDITVKGE